MIQLPDGFTLAPQDRWTDEIKEETEGVYFTQYSDDQPNILLVPPGDQHQEIVFRSCHPTLPPTATFTSANTRCSCGNRGRGQVYPTGEKSNNTVFTAPATGTIDSIEDGDNGAKVVTISNEDGSSVSETIPVGPTLLVASGDSVVAGAPLTNDPNVGGLANTLRWCCRTLFASTACSLSSPLLPSPKSCWC